MTPEQFHRIESLLAGLNTRLDQMLADNAWSIARMKRLDQAGHLREFQYEMDRVRCQQAQKLTADRIDELRERDRARDKETRDILTDQAIRTGLFEEWMTPKKGPKG